MTAAPLPDAAVHESRTWPLDAVAVTPVGAIGTPAGVTAAEAAETRPRPSALVARTVKV